jgi:hypothetical protein
MDNTNGSGVEYPKITLGGVEYTLKASKAVLTFRFSKYGIPFNRFGPSAGAVLAEQLWAFLLGQYFGSAESLFEMMFNEGKLREVAFAVDEAVKKVFPPQVPAAPAAKLEADPEVPLQ